MKMIEKKGKTTRQCKQNENRGDGEDYIGNDEKWSGKRWN